MKKTIKWGILAPGHIAEKFASDLKLVKNATLHAVASRSIERSRDFANRFEVENYYGSYEELTKDKDIDVIYIASPHPFHYEHTKLCLNNGKHVLCEKPMGMNAREVQEMSTLAKEKGLFLMEAFWTQFHPSFKRCMELVNNKEIGDIHTINADFGFFVSSENVNGRLLNKELGGGALLDIGIYPVFFALTFMGKPDKIIANGILGPTGVDLNNQIMFQQNKNQCLANLTSTIQANLPTEAIIAGSKGYLRLNRMWHCPTSLEISINGKTTTEQFEEAGYGYEHEAEEVTQCLLEEKQESNIFPISKSMLLHSTLDEVRRQIGLKYKSD